MPTCPDCGFVGEEEDFNAEVKQHSDGNANYINVGFGCRRCHAKFW